MRSVPMLKCSSERCVCAPHSLSAGTSTTPRLSLSCLISTIEFSSTLELLNWLSPHCRSILGGRSSSSEVFVPRPQVRKLVEHCRWSPGSQAPETRSPKARVAKDTHDTALRGKSLRPSTAAWWHSPLRIPILETANRNRKQCKPAQCVQWPYHQSVQKSCDS